MESDSVCFVVREHPVSDPKGNKVYVGLGEKYNIFVYKT